MLVISVSSFKGGTAKTSTSLHIASALARFHKKKVLLIDFDAQANLTTGLGFDPDEQDSMATVLQGEKPIHEVILSTCVPNMHIVPADTWLERVEVSGSLAADRYSHERLKEILSNLPYDFVLIDTPPSLCWLTESALIASQYSLVCATPEFYSVSNRGVNFISMTIPNLPCPMPGRASPECLAAERRDRAECWGRVASPIGAGRGPRRRAVLLA